MSHKLHYVKNSEPKFIQQFKERVGMKKSATVEDKAAHIDSPLDDRSDNEDEKPVIVLPKDSSVTEEEVEQVRDGKIKYRKPGTNKRSSGQGISASSKKTDDSAKEPPIKKSKTKSKKTRSANLLSFNADEDEV